MNSPSAELKIVTWRLPLSNTIFVATGVTNGALLQGVRFENGFVHTDTLVMNSSTRTVREVRMKRAL